MLAPRFGTISCVVTPFLAPCCPGGPGWYPDAELPTEIQSLSVPRQLEVSAADDDAPVYRPDGAFPIDGPGRESRVILLIVEQRFEFDLPRSRAHGPGDRVGNSCSG